MSHSTSKSDFFKWTKPAEDADPPETIGALPGSFESAWNELANTLLRYAVDTEILNRSREILDADVGHPLGREPDASTLPREIPADVVQAREVIDDFENGMALLETALEVFKHHGFLRLWDGSTPSARPSQIHPDPYEPYAHLSIHEGRSARLALLLESDPVLKRPYCLIDLLYGEESDVIDADLRKEDDRDRDYHLKNVLNSLRRVYLHDGRCLYVKTGGKTGKAELESVTEMARRVRKWWREKKREFSLGPEDHRRAIQRLRVLDS